MDNQIVITEKKKFSDYLPNWLKNLDSLFYYFVFLTLLGVLFFATSLFVNYFTTPFTGDYCMQQFAFYTNGYGDWWHFLTTGEFVLYDTNTFLGVNNIGSNSFYYLFDPFFLPILLVPRQLVPQGMALLTIFKIAGSGMAFFAYMRYLGASRRASKITGIAYAFSGWMTWYLWFNHFTEVALVPHEPQRFRTAPLRGRHRPHRRGLRSHQPQGEQHHRACRKAGGRLAEALRHPRLDGLHPQRAPVFHGQRAILLSPQAERSLRGRAQSGRQRGLSGEDGRETPSRQRAQRVHDRFRLHRHAGQAPARGLARHDHERPVRRLQGQDPRQHPRLLAR